MRDALAWTSTLLAAVTFLWSLRQLPAVDAHQMFAVPRGSLLDEALAESSPSVPPKPATLPRVREGMPWIDMRLLAFPDYDPPELRGESPTPLQAQDFPPAMAALDGRSVVVSGHPLVLEVESGLVQTLLLTRFPPGCCFGTVPVLDEWIEVHLDRASDTFSATTGPITVTGILRVGEQLDEDGYVHSLYRLRAARLLKN